MLKRKRETKRETTKVRNKGYNRATAGPPTSRPRRSLPVHQQQSQPAWQLMGTTPTTFDGPPNDMMARLQKALPKSDPPTFTGDEDKLDYFLADVTAYYSTRTIDIRDPAVDRMVGPCIGEHLKQEARTWYIDTFARTPPSSWSELKDRMISRFGGVDKPNDDRRLLMDITQGGSIEKYLGEFITRVEATKTLPTTWQLTLLEARLKDKQVRAYLKLNKPKTLQDAIEAIRTGDRIYNGGQGQKTNTAVSGQLKAAKGQTCTVCQSTRHAEDDCWINYPDL